MSNLNINVKVQCQCQSSTSILKLNVSVKVQRQYQRSNLFKCPTSVECCLFYLIDRCDNGWKFYGNHCYLFGFNKINWHDAKVSMIVINKIKYLLPLKIQLSREEASPINQLKPYTFVVPVPRQDLDFQRHMPQSFLFLQVDKVRGSR